MAKPALNWDDTQRDRLVRQVMPASESAALAGYVDDLVKVVEAAKTLRRGIEDSSDDELLDITSWLTWDDLGIAVETVDGWRGVS